MNKASEEIKYKISWVIGAGLSSILYFSGIIFLYSFFRKTVLRRYRTVVLTYHRIREDGRDPDISVSTEMFKRQMAYLKKNFNIISLNNLANNKEIYIRADRVAITFDDGYSDNFLNAYPILNKHRLPATIFLVSEDIGKSNETLSINEIEKMKNDGIDFGSHTATHRILTGLDSDTVSKEISESKKTLENIIGKKIEFFAFPKGKRSHFNEKLKALIKDAGYKAAFTTENGAIDSGSDLFELKRIGVRNCPLFVFKTRVSGIFESKLFYFARNILRLT